MATQLLNCFTQRKLMGSCLVCSTNVFSAADTAVITSAWATCWAVHHFESGNKSTTFSSSCSHWNKDTVSPDFLMTLLAELMTCCQLCSLINKMQVLLICSLFSNVLVFFLHPNWKIVPWGLVLCEKTHLGHFVAEFCFKSICCNKLKKKTGFVHF